MDNEVRYLMSQKQLNRFTVITKVIDGGLSLAEAAASLQISPRQVIRLKKGVLAEGAACLIHKSTHRKPSHALQEDILQRIIALKQTENYKDANFLHFQELLEDRENIKISYSALHRTLCMAGIKSPKKRRRFKPHRRRKRRSQAGSLIQMDATPFEWFGGSQKFSLHGAIDDATGQIVGLYLTQNECLHGYWEVTRQMLLRHGVPISIYADRHAIFLSQNAGKLSIEDQLAGKVVNDTQFGRAMTQLGVTLIPARSPQAKGRVERLWQTLQSRLPVEFLIAGISTIDDANAFLASYIDVFNNRFSVTPDNSEPAFRPLPSHIDIDSVLCLQMTRVVDAGFVFSFYNRHFVLTAPAKSILPPPKAKITVLVSPRFGVKAQYQGAVFDTLPFIKPPKKSTTTPASSSAAAPWKPPDSHYFKYGHSLMPKLSFEDSNLDILLMLNEIFLRKFA
jgi:transposase